MGDWLNPLNRIAIRKSVTNSWSSVKLDDGRLLNIEYMKDGKTVMLSPPRGYGLVPMGYFPIAKIKDEQWITADKV
jgi:hypothetical protein